MSWIKKILGAAPVKPGAPEDVLKQLDGLANLIAQEVQQQLSKLSPLLNQLEVNEMMGEKEHASALESVYWAISLLRLIEKSEQGWISQSWVPQLLNDILNEMESKKRGCRVRFARQMLQEYAEIQIKNPEKSYHTETMLSYFRAWLWECLKAPAAEKPNEEKLKLFDKVVTPYLLNQTIWK
jgi:hypothetical protein